MNGQGLYGMDGDTHIGFDHNALAELLKNVIDGFYLAMIM